MLENRTKFRTGLIGTAAVALMGASVMMANVKDASATAYAYASIEVTNFKIAGLTSGFSTFKFLEKGMNVNLNGDTASTPASAPRSPAASRESPSTRGRR